MRKIIFVLVLMATVILGQAMTVNGLFKKYQDFPEAQYLKMNEKELKAQMDSVSSEEEKEILRTAKSMQMLLFVLEEEDQKQKLTDDLTSLKHYSLALSFTHNNGEQSINIVGDGNVSKEALKGFVESFINPTISVDVYGNEKSREDIIAKPLFLMNFWGMTGLIYIDGEIKAGDADKVLQFTTNTDTTIKIERVDPTEESIGY